MFKRDRILTLNIGATRLTLAEFRFLNTGGMEMGAYGIAPLEMSPDEELDASPYVVAALRDLLVSKGIRPGPVAVAISSQLAFTTFVKLPPVQKEKIAQIVRYEAQQNIPSIEETIWDYQLIAGGEGEVAAMIIAAKQDLVKRITDCVEAAGLFPELVEVSHLALYNALRYNYPDVEGCSMLLDIGGRVTTVLFAEGTRIFSRTVPIAGNTITREVMKEFGVPFAEAEKLKLEHAFVGFGSSYDEGGKTPRERVGRVVRNVMTRLHAEISRTINFYRSQQGGSQPVRLFLTGGSSLIDRLDEFMADKLKLPVELFNPFSNMPVSQALDLEQVGRDVFFLGSNVGVALRLAGACPIEISLMPEDLVRERQFFARIPFFATAAAAVLAGVGIWGLFYYQDSREYDVLSERTARQVAALRGTERQLTELKRKQGEAWEQASRLFDCVAKRTQWLEALEELHKKVPAGMWLTDIRILESPAGEDVTGGTRSARRFQIQGQSFDDRISQKAITEFANSLKESRFWTDPVGVTRIKPVDGTDFMTEFVIEAGVKSL